MLRRSGFGLVEVPFCIGVSGSFFLFRRFVCGKPRWDKVNKVYEQVKDYLDCKARGTIHIKGKGAMLTYFLEGVKTVAPGNVAIQ